MTKWYTRSEAVTVLEAMLAEFENDHEEFTGVSDTERFTLKEWWQEIGNLIENTS